MPHVKYTRAMLSEAVAASTSVAGVLRHLGLPQNGGAHAHLRRRIEKFGVDTSHFLGQAHFRGLPSPTRQRPDEVLVLRAPTQNREKPARLRRALQEIGRPYLCASCGVGDIHNGAALVLHVDHIDGRLWDCRPGNVRFLCPNCHSQTPTYAGRKSSPQPHALVAVDDQGDPLAQPPPIEPLDQEQLVEVINRVTRRELRPGQAAQLIGCTKATVYRMQRRLAERGSLTPTRRPPMTPATRQAILEMAVTHPQWGPQRITAELSQRRPGPIDVTAPAVSSALFLAGLHRRSTTSPTGNCVPPSTA